MANPEHVRVVRQGATAIEEWRTEHPSARLDLLGADLRAADLRGANLIGVDLRGVDLSGADLNEADLREANLFAANLSQAKLFWTDLRRAHLKGADLRHALLGGTIFSYADLQGADIAFARFAATEFGDTDLTGTLGLEAVIHDGPSPIDELTLRKSWPLPEVFLRGVGLSDDLIAFYRATLGKAIEFYSCFISYSSKDDEFARRLHADLQDKGVRCWFAPKDLPIGTKQREFIDESIRVHDKLLLVLSEHSVKSGWVEKEVATAIETHEKTGRSALFPIRLDDAVMKIDTGWPADVRRIWNIGDFGRWKEHDAYQGAFERLMRDLKSEPTATG
ncbi:MAG: toll/interleukin-1 receptor domain-containing protein [Dehalococcoidia bacterium]